MTPVAILSPHLDDAVLSAWTVLRRPDEVRVVNVCAGIPPAGRPPRWDRLTGAHDAAERMRERHAEDRAALAHAGREATQLDFVDAHYRDGPLDPERLLAALREAAGDAGELWAPAGIGDHPDHVQVRDAALRLAGEGRPLRLYAELPYAGRYGWPAWVTGRASRSGLDVDAWFDDFLPGGTSPPGSAHRLSPLELRRKMRAVDEYRTQRAALDAGWRMGERRVMRYEASFTPGTAG
ncbi:MAG TPA: PIG-L family deacetylase [Thermoleophilaceae bacterium]|nr:PIG-L family deacetylase [Thermoleophilaceae bacterium]